MMTISKQTHIGADGAHHPDTEGTYWNPSFSG